MIHNISDFFQDDAWQKLAADAEELVCEMVEQRTQTELLGELKQRFVKLKLGHLKLRLLNLRQSLQQHMAMLEEEILVEPDDEAARYLLAQGAEQLADMWLMESLLDRLSRPAVPSSSAWPDNMLYDSASARSNQPGRSSN
jgi:hypothetical protein